MNKPHSREKRVINKKVEVVKRPVNIDANKQNALFNILRKIVKKWEEIIN